MSSSCSSVVVSCDWNGAPSTFDLPAHADLSTLWKALKDTYSNLPEPFTAAGASFRLTYKDAEGDDIELETQGDLADAIAQTMTAKNRIMLLFVRPPTHVAMGRSGLLGEWSHVDEDSRSPALAGQAAPAAEAPALVLEQPKAEAVPAPAAAPAVVEAAAPAAVQVEAPAPQSGAGVLGWFGWNRSPVAVAPAPVVKAPEVAVAPVSDAASSVSSPAVAPLSDSELVKAASQKDWASVSSSQDLSPPRDLEANLSQNSSQSSSMLSSNTFVAAMDEQANNGRPDVLAQVFQSMIRRAEERVGVAYLPASASSFSSAWVRKPTALLEALKDMDASSFSACIDQFAEVAAQHVAAREARLAAEEAARVAELVAEMERQALREEQARQQERELARQAELRAEAARKAEAEELAAIERKKIEIALAEQRLLEERAAAAEMEARAAARAERAAREAAAAAAAAAVPVPRLPSEPCLAFAPALPSPVLAPAASQSPVLIPSVAVPVASPLGSEALSASQRINSLLTDLRSMGFTNDQLNTQLLQQTNFDIGATLDWLQTDAATGGELSAAMRRA